MTPAVGSKLITVIHKSLEKLLYSLSVFCDVWIGLHFRITILGGLVIGFIRTVTENTVVTGKCHDSLGSSVGEIRMSLNKVIKNRNYIIITDGDITLCICVLELQLSVLIENHLVCKTLAFHVLIVANIIL